MKKIWTIAILTVLLFSGRVFAGDAVKPAPGWLSSGTKVATMTDTQLRQQALSEITLTDTWLNDHGYSRELKDEVLKKMWIYEKEGLYYSRSNNRLVTSNISEEEWQIKRNMKMIKKQRAQ